MNILIAQIMLYTFLALLGVCIIIYIPRLVCYFAPFKKQKKLNNLKKNKICVMIPARNESKIIRGIMDCLKAQDYPKDKFDAVFIVKTNDDPTIKIAKEYGFKSCLADQQHNKAEALDICYSKLKKSGIDYDAYMVIDADCWLKENCLTEVNHGLSSNADIVTCKKISKNYILKGSNSGSLSGMCNGTIWPLIDELGNRYKSDRGICQMTISTGIVFTKNALEKMNGLKFNKTMTEDMEIMFASRLYGLKEYYCSYAVIYMDEAESFRVTTVRRNRWLRGYVESKRIYEPILKASLKTTKDKIERYFLNGLYPVFWTYGLSFLFIVISLISAFILLFSDISVAPYFLFNALVSFGFIYLSFFLMSLFVVIVDWKQMKCSVWKRIFVIFFNPFYEMGYFSVCLKALFGKEEEIWIPIERNASVGIEAKEGIK